MIRSLIEQLRMAELNNYVGKLFCLILPQHPYHDSNNPIVIFQQIQFLYCELLQVQTPAIPQRPLNYSLLFSQ